MPDNFTRQGTASRREIVNLNFFPQNMNEFEKQVQTLESFHLLISKYCTDKLVKKTHLHLNLAWFGVTLQYSVYSSDLNCDSSML